jgi:hypothetical protein
MYSISCVSATYAQIYTERVQQQGVNRNVLASRKWGKRKSEYNMYRILYKEWGWKGGVSKGEELKVDQGGIIGGKS